MGPATHYAWRNHVYVIRYYVIRSFRDRRTAALFQGRFVRSIDSRIVARARRKLQMIHAAGSLDELGVVPGNRLEALRGDRNGQHSIRINDQWRICFVWRAGKAHDVEFADYH
jgi:proteic killer suppression protein